jgi:tetratricopeptide (TPR) repeat protein
LEIDPRIEKAYQNIASIYCYHRYDNALVAEWSSFALKLNKNNEYAILMRELVREDVNARINNLMNMATQFPSFVRIHNAIGTSYLEINKISEAIEWFEKGLRSNSKYDPLTYGLAMAYNRLGNSEAAIRLS